MTLKELREKRGKIKSQIDGIIAAADKDNDGVFTAEQSADIERLEAEYASVDAAIKVKERAEARNGEGAAPTARRAAAADGPIEPTTITDVKVRFEDDPKKGFRSSREFFTQVMKHPAHEPARTAKDERLRFLAAAGSDEQSTFSEGYGGFLLPVGFGPAGLLSVSPDDDPLAGLTTNVPMQTPVVPIDYRVDKDHSTSVSGGLRFYRRGEAAAATASRMQVAKLRLTAFELMGLNYASEELLTDSPQSVIGLLEAGFRTELGSVLLDERLNGTGVGEFLGINNCPALVTVSKETGQAADTIVYQNIIKMRARSYGYSKSVWIANHDCLPQLMLLNQSIGTGGMPVWQPSAREDHPDVLFGRPLYFNEHLETVGDAGDILLVNPAEYLEGVYQPLQSAESIHVRFVNHERAFKIWMRNAGSPWWDSALTPKKGANTLSPFVRLAARA